MIKKEMTLKLTFSARLLKPKKPNNNNNNNNEVDDDDDDYDQLITHHHKPGDDENEKENEKENEEVGDDDDKQREQHQEKNKKIIISCKYCKREFNSEKALGGHLRTHKQHIPTSKTIKSNNIKTSSLQTTHQQHPECSICGKVFLSLKAVYGHMRSHSTMNGSTKRSAAVAELDAAVEAEAQVVAPEPEPEPEPEFLAAEAEEPVCNGRVVVGDDNNDVGRNQKTRNDELAAAIKKDMATKQLDEDELYYLQGFLDQLIPPPPNNNNNSSNFINNNNKLPPIIPTPNNNHINKNPTFPSLKNNNYYYSNNPTTTAAADEASTSRSIPKKQVTFNNFKRKKTIIINANDDDGVQQELFDKKWKCYDCNKSFKNHQALGGHMSSHKKASGIIIRQPSESSPENRGNGGLQQPEQRTNDIRSSPQEMFDFDLNVIPEDD